jgi:hypothetical protein
MVLNDTVTASRCSSFHSAEWRCGLMYKRCIETFYQQEYLWMCGRRSVAGNVSLIGITSADPTKGSPFLPQKNCGSEQDSDFLLSQGPEISHN